MSSTFLIIFHFFQITNSTRKGVAAGDTRFFDYFFGRKKSLKTRLDLGCSAKATPIFVLD
jgi:hypothetical protein